jgi:hypothetical protein
MFPTTSTLPWSIPSAACSLAASSPDDLSAEEKLRHKGLNQLFKEALD